MVTYREWLAERMCAGKLAWPKARAAKRSTAEAAEHYGEARDDWSHYRCLVCGLYHIGHISEQTRQERQASYGTA